MRNDPLTRIKIAKFVAPEMFENKSPVIHIDMLEHSTSPSKYAVQSLFRGAGKTTVNNKIDTFADIFLDHEPYQQIFSATQDKAKKFLNDVKTMVINGMQKGLSIEKGSIWSQTEIEVIVDGKFKCFVECMGAGQDPRGGSYNFLRPTKQRYDDIESKVGQYAIRTKANREKLKEWFYGDCLPSLDPIKGKVRFVGTILHADSLLMSLLKNPEWQQMVRPIIIDGKSAWADRFPLTDIEAKEREERHFEETGKRVEIKSIESIKRELYDQGKHDLFYQEYLCLPQSEEKKLFKAEDFRYFSHIRYDDKVTSIHFGNAKESETIYTKQPQAIVFDDGTELTLDKCYIYSSMDLASDGADKSAIITVAFDGSGNWYILDISNGHWTPFQKSANAIRIQMQFQPIRFGIEKASAQNDFFYTIDVAQKETGVRIPVEELKHGGVNKNIRISNLQPLFFTHKIHFDRSCMNVSELEAQLTTFDIDVESLHDDLMDALAYQLQFTKGRTFDNEWEDEEEFESTW
jgi:predicted phage terminase large subunit-like protein